jgi:hypothetical protein
MNLLSTSTRTVVSSINKRNAAIGIANSAEDYTCLDYKCLMLDAIATAYDANKEISSFISANMAKQVFEVATTNFCFYQTLRNKYKKTNILDCK